MASSTRQNDADANRSSTGFEGLVREFSNVARVTRRDKTAGLAALKSEIAGIIREDYRRALRQCLSRWEVREIVDEGKTRVWPGLNQEPVRLVSPHEFVRRWSSFGVDFKFASLPWKEGLSLLGFYVKKIDQVRMRPLIFVNTAHHPAVVGVALDHEMGHHLTSQIFAASARVHLLSQTGFEEHLTEPAELAADILVSLGIFPAPIARKLFSGANRIAAHSEADELSGLEFSKLLEYVANRYGFGFDHMRGVNTKLQTLAGLVHYAKLRRALLDEYGR
ncbi:MAG: hypothetical protein JOZ29_07180 [Deltaproteobacteria bacterium]|nr:hypothetical protein [Deltaproteobacteria bacterium]MBV8452045.1 hypothetical protein [Deltaproteobacteria bacterium]